MGRCLVKKNQTHHSNEHRRFPAQALIEMALILPLILILVIGAMDLGRLFYMKIVLTNAAREGANYLSRYPADIVNCVDDICFYNTWQAIQTEGASSGITISYEEIDWTNTNCCTAGTEVQIGITKSVDLLFGGFLEAFGIINGPIELTSSVNMVVQ